MQFWDTIIDTAMLGTEKKQVSTHDLPPALQEAATLIGGAADTDREEVFLQLAALTLNYRQCGVEPLQKELMIIPAPPEEKTYISEQASQVLKDILAEDSVHLLRAWLQHCIKKMQIVQPELVPLLLAKGTEQKKLRLMIAACCGKRGEWLGSFNKNWNFSSAQTEEELWQTGLYEQRKEILKQTRIAEPAKAREWLVQTWAQEDANTKAGLLEVLEYNISVDDMPFLEGLYEEKSKKVKDIQLRLLKQIPGSPVVRLYEEILGAAVHLKKERSLLGMISKSSLQCSLPETMPGDIYKTGIDKLSNTKELTDDEYVVAQLMQAVPPSFWEKHLEMNRQQIIEFFQKDQQGKKLLSSLARAVVQFNDSAWASAFMNYSNVFYIDIIPLLQPAQQELYSTRFFDKYPDDIIRYAATSEAEWSTDLTKLIFSHTANNPYQYNRSFYHQHIHLVPAQAVGLLEKCTPAEEYLRTMWSNTSEYIIKLITLKIQTIKAFNT